jgi:hypothetical protein
MTLRIIIIILTLVLASCSYSDKDFNLNATERSFLNAFKKGDTLYYESSRGQVEKILVLGVDSAQKRESGYLIALPASNQIFIKIQHIPIDTFQTLAQFGNAMKFDTISESVITISKFPQEKETQYTFQFKHFLSSTKKGLEAIHSDTILNGHKLTNYFILKDDFPNNDTSSTKVEELYWTKNEGLVAYKLKNGIYWTKESSR